MCWLDIPKTGKKKRLNWTYHSIRLGRLQNHGGKQKAFLTCWQQEKMRKMKKQKPLIKPSYLMKLLNYHKNRTGKTTPWFNYLPLGKRIPQHVGILGDTINVQIWVGTQPNHIILPLASPNLMSSHFKTNHAIQQSPKVLTHFSINPKVLSPKSHLRQGK